LILEGFRPVDRRRRRRELRMNQASKLSVA
jgi:hypothetical protein